MPAGVRGVAARASRPPRAIAMLLAALVLAACGPSGVSGAGPTAVDHEVLARGDQPADPPAGDDGGYRVITAAPAFATAFRGMTGRPPPDVDFTRHRVLLLDAGIRPSAGHAIGVAAVRRAEGATVVEVRRRRPGQGCMSAAVMTRPYAFVRIPAAGGPVRFREQVESVACE